MWGNLLLYEKPLPPRRFLGGVVSTERSASGRGTSLRVRMCAVKKDHVISFCVEQMAGLAAGTVCGTGCGTAPRPRVKEVFLPCSLCEDAVREGSMRFDVLDPHPPSA